MSDNSSNNWQPQNLELTNRCNLPENSDRSHISQTARSASQRYRQRKHEQSRQESWFRHSMPPSLSRDFESIDNLTSSTTNGLDEQLVASFASHLTNPSFSGSGISTGCASENATICGSHREALNLNSANSNLGFIDSDTPNSPMTPIHSHSYSFANQQYSTLQRAGQPQLATHEESYSGSLAGTLSSSNAAHTSRRKNSRLPRTSLSSLFSKRSANSIKSRASAMANHGLRITASFLRKKRKEYEGKFIKHLK